MPKITVEIKPETLGKLFKTGRDVLVKHMLPEEVASLVSEVVERGTTFCTLIALTDGRARKTGNPFPDAKIYKLQEVHGVVGYDYQSTVNRERKREGLEADFEAQGRTWGVRRNRAIVDHEGRPYLTVKPEHLMGLIYLDKNGNEISAEVAKQFLPERAKSQTQGVENDVKPCDYDICNIQMLRITRKASDGRNTETYFIYPTPVPSTK